MQSLQSYSFRVCTEPAYCGSICCNATKYFGHFLLNHRLRLKRKGIGNDQASLCKWLKHSALWFRDYFCFDRTLVVFQPLSYPLAITQRLGGYSREVSLHSAVFTLFLSIEWITPCQLFSFPAAKPKQQKSYGFMPHKRLQYSLL